MRAYILLSVLLGLAAGLPGKGNSNNNNNAAATTTTAAPTTTTASTVVDGDVRILEYLTQSDTPIHLYLIFVRSSLENQVRQPGFLTSKNQF